MKTVGMARESLEMKAIGVALRVVAEILWDEQALLSHLDAKYINAWPVAHRCVQQVCCCAKHDQSLLSLHPWCFAARD